MPINDYSDDEDYYTQGFRKNGVISVWIGLKDRTNEPAVDALQDLCGVGYYSLDDQESNCFDFQEVEVIKLLEELSYSNTFLNDALKAASDHGITKARWVVVQYDFEYDPTKVLRKIEDDPVFIGSFPYSTT